MSDLNLRMLAVTAVVLAGALGFSAGTADAKLLVIPWTNHPATPALISSLLPKPIPPSVPRTGAPPCSSSHLALQPTFPLSMSQNDGVMIRLRNTGSQACLLQASPRVVAVASQHPTVSAKSLGLAWANGEVANTPAGGLVYLAVSVPIACASNPGGSDQGYATYHRLVITLPGGDTRSIRGLNLTFPCGMATTSFFMPKPSPTYAPYWIKNLKPKISLPTSVKAGGTLVYQVTLTNPLNRSVTLSPCPVYIEHSSTGIKLEYQLNCSFVHTIPARGVYIFAMKMAIPHTTPSGPMTVFWELIGPGNPSPRAIVNVN